MGSQITTSVTIINSGLKGYQALTLTNYTGSAVSAIAAGSSVEIAGAFFLFSSEESVTGLSAIATAATAYVALTPSGTAGSQIVSASWTATAPTWSESKQGWYTSTDSVIRVIGGGVKTGATAMEPKLLFTPAVQNNSIRLWSDGSADFTAIDGTTITTSGAATIGSTLGVTGAATVGGNLGVTGAATIGSTLGVTGTASLGALTLSGTFLLRTNPSTGSKTINAGANWEPSRGIYVVGSKSGAGTLKLQIYSGGSWQAGSNLEFVGGTIISGGSNTVRLINYDGSFSATIYYAQY